MKVLIVLELDVPRRDMSGVQAGMPAFEQLDHYKDAHLITGSPARAILRVIEATKKETH